MSSLYLIARKECPVCGSKSFSTLYQNQYSSKTIKEYLLNFYNPQGMVELEYLEDAIYVLCECDKCKTIFQKYIPNSFLSERLYEHWIDPVIVYERRQKNDHFEYYTKYAQEIMQILCFLKKVPSDLKIFDFGMGWAKWALMVKSFGCDSYGTDLSHKRIKHAQKNGIKILKMENLSQYQFDLINAEQVFEHLSDPLQTLKYLKSALKSDGIIKISVPTANNISSRLKIMDWKASVKSKNSLNPVAPLEHINFFRRNSLTVMANEAGMVEVKIPILIQYRYSIDWGSIKKSSKHLFLPIYRNVLKKQNYIFLRKK